jgi:hypothetical protein
MVPVAGSVRSLRWNWWLRSVLTRRTHGEDREAGAQITRRTADSLSAEEIALSSSRDQT